MPVRVALLILAIAMLGGTAAASASLGAAAPLDQLIQQWPFATVFSLPIEAQRGVTIGTTTNSPNPTNMLDVVGSASISSSLAVGSAVGTATPAALTGAYSKSATWNPASISATPGTAAYATVTVPNANGGDNVTASFGPLTTGSGTPIASNGVVITGAVTAANTCTVAIQNYTGSALDLDSATVRCTVHQY